MPGGLTLSSVQEKKYTLLSNLFIDHYMPQANGAYVKVYLYLLRLLGAEGKECTLTSVADALDETEKDIERALKYWEDKNLMRLEREEGAAITGVAFLEPPEIQKTQEKREGKEETSSLESAETEQKEEVLSQSSTELTAEAGAVGKKCVLPQKPDYSEAQIEVLTSLDEVKEMLMRIQQVTVRLLKGADLNFVLYLYESVGFSADLIVYLYEYCASKNKMYISYIESVAIAWAEEGIDTVQKAKTETAVYNDSYSTVNRAFGLNRAPGSVEIQYLHRWTSNYGFDTSIIEEACNRTMLAVSKPDFKYADKILERWYKAGVREREDIATLDEEFAKRNIKMEQQRDNTYRSAAPNNRFNAFPQRKYTASDYSAMEKQLLGSR